MKAAVFFNALKENNTQVVQNVVESLLNKFDLEILMPEEYRSSFNEHKVDFFESPESAVKNCDIVVIIGGDGAILYHSKLAAKHGKPIIGINNGSLGFLAGLELNQIDDFYKIISGNYTILKRMMIEVSFPGKKETFYALNDVVLTRDTKSQIVDYKILRDEEKIYNCCSDGIIIATPTGSTAYSLSAGGPIVDPSMECLIVTPICAHSLAARPLILNSSEEIKVEYSLEHDLEVCLAVDGLIHGKFENSDFIKIKKSNLTADFICLKNNDFFDKLNAKMRW